MPKVNAAHTTLPEFPASPPPRVSAYELAAQLPELWQARGEYDRQAVLYQDGTEVWRAVSLQMEVLGNRINAIEEAAFETPAQNLADACSHLVLMYERLQMAQDCQWPDGSFDMNAELRALWGALQVILPTCSIDFSELVKCYVPCANMEAAQ